jgi:hypothetical protein
MSALCPNDWNQAVDNVYKMLKPGGLVLFRGIILYIYNYCLLAILTYPI